MAENVKVWEEDILLPTVLAKPKRIRCSLRSVSTKEAAGWFILMR